MIQTAIILAGGFGTRLQSLVKDLPKPMATIIDKPFLVYQLKFLKHFGIKKIIFSVGYKYESMQHYFGNRFEEMEIQYSIEDSPLGTGGGIRLAMEKTEDENTLVLNGDSFFDFDLKKFMELHFEKNCLCSLALRKVENASRFGTIEINSENRIISFKEKSNLNHAGIINAGIYILSKDNYIAETIDSRSFSIEKDFFELKFESKDIYGFEFDGYFIDIGLPEDYLKAQHDFTRFAY